MQTSNIHKRVIAGIFALFSALQMSASDTKGEIRITDPQLTRNDGVMTVGMDINFSGQIVKTTGAMVLTPMIVNGLDTLKLPSISIYGRANWYMSDRNKRIPLSHNDENSIRFDKKLEPIKYSQRVQYAEWMNGADLIVERTDYGCAGCSDDPEISELARYKNVVYEPVFMYQAVAAEAVKTRELSGRAYIDFPVNRTEIYPDYRKNPEELAKIIATIDSVRNDKDINVTLITVKGYASPEGSYENNIRLAKGRTETLKQYVQKLYNFAPGFIVTDYEPEDWEGLREYVEGCSLPHRNELLSIINDETIGPDPKDWRMKLRYPEDYKHLLSVVYPALRHSDYRIEYTIRSFSDPAEIREVLHTNPRKLSLNEIYLAARGLEPGSDEYNEIFETAARLFPSEPAANLNAANAVMQRGDLAGAEYYLERAGDSPEAVYARGVYAALGGDFAKGIELVEQAVSQGIKDEQGILDHMREAAKYAN